MIFDLFDYLFGIIKMLIYKIFYLGKLKSPLVGKYSRSTQIRIFGKGKITFGSNPLFRAGVKIRINGGNLKIGDNVGFNNYCLVNCMDSITIGDNVIIGQNVSFYDHDHNYKTEKDIAIRDNGYKTDPIKIGNNVWIGSNVVILRGVTIGDNVVIGANTVVKKDIPANTVNFAKEELVSKEY